MISHQIVFHVTFMGGSTKKKIFYNMSGFTHYLCVYIYLLYKKMAGCLAQRIIILYYIIPCFLFLCSWNIFSCFKIYFYAIFIHQLC
jgi:hypothetical protein